jgi:transglutaminase-like putative cysteine protease
MRLFVILFCLATTICVAKEQPKYPVNAIQESLKKNVDIVIRNDQTIFKIISKSRAILHVHYAVTIFNESGKHHARQTVGYDKLSKITGFKGTSYNANGEVIKKLKSSEIYDQSAFDGFSLYSDNRFKSANLAHGSYPYTVEFEYDVEYKYLFMIPGAYVLPGDKASVENFEYTLIYPKNLEPRYRAFHIQREPDISTTNDGMESVSWLIKDIKPITFESVGPSREELIPRIIAAPNQFEYEGYTGVMDTWEKFGQWIASLNNGRGTISEPTKNKVLEITAGLHTPEEKAKAIYEFMQDKTRYVSIQLGIGGFQPFEAKVVDETGYGDCKALSNYMVSLLNVAGVKAHYTLIRAGEYAASMKTDFPSSQFNHAVVCVPNGLDTLWLECTSQTNPFGYMGSFTGDRMALAITDHGAKIVTTPRYPGEINTQLRTAEVTLSFSGDAQAHVVTSYSGLQYENDNLHFILGNQFDKQKEWIQENTNIPSFDIASFKITNHKSKIPSAVVEVDYKLNRLATVSGKRLFITPNLMNRSSYIPPKVEERKTNVVRRFEYTDIDTVRYKMPEGIYPEFLPEPVTLQSRFGEYESSVTIDRGDVLYIRKMKTNKGVFPPESYNELIDFYKSVNKADNTKLVFLNKT